MIQKLFIVVGTVILCLTSQAQLQKPGQEGSGGGGIIKNGKYVTFYSAGIYTSKIPERLKAIPGAEKLLHEINNFPGLSVTKKGLWTKKIIASINRRYFKVLKEQVDDKAIENLIQKYRDTLDIDESNALGVFAITDIKSETTLLLPEFYNLNEFEQMAILFHEAFWLVFPQSSYQETINAEVTAQEYFETKDSLSGLELLKAIDAYSDSLFYAVEQDLKNKAFGDLIKGKKILAQDLLGFDFLNCLTKYELDYCRPFLADHSYTFGLLYPDSLLLYLITEIQFENYKEDNYNRSLTNDFYDFEIRNYSEISLKEAYVILNRENRNKLTLEVLSDKSRSGGQSAKTRNLLRLMLYKDKK